MTTRIEELLREAIRSEIARIHTMMPGIVESFDSAKCRATIRPAIMARHRNEEGEYEYTEMPVLENVPVLFPGNGTGISVTWPVEEGDEVTLGFMERSMAEWKKEGGKGTQPYDPRRFDLTDAVAWPNPMSLNRTAHGYAKASTYVITAPAVALGSKDAAHPLSYGDVVQDLFTRLATLLPSMMPLDSMGLPVPFASDTVGQDGKGNVGVVAVSTGLQAVIPQSVSNKVKTE